MPNEIRCFEMYLRIVLQEKLRHLKDLANLKRKNAFPSFSFTLVASKHSPV